MARPRRSAARKAEAQRVAECDGGTALELVEPDAEQRQSDEPEEIDTEEDDSEFDERAHWGRRRTRPQKNDSNTKKKLKKTAEDKAQPKINLFCVLQSATNVSDDAVVQEGDGEVTVKSGEMEVEPRNVRDQVHTVHSVNEDPTLEPSAAGIEITEDSNGGSSVEVLVAASANVAPQNGDQEVASVLTGRPKRQARVRAEEAQAQANLFTTPPSAPSRRPSSASRATLDGEADKKTSSGTSSARKRKLEMAGEKKKNASNAVPIGGSTKVRTPSSVFFLTEEQKKQVIEIEAVASFKEQLKQQRERDLEFFGQRVVKNPFFEARMGSQKSIDGENGKCEEIIDLSDSPRTSPVKSKSRWSSMPLEFPSLQHSIPDSSEANATRSAFALPLKKPTPNERPCVIDLDDEDMESNRFFSHKAFKFATDTADMQVAFDDAFWLMAAPTSNDGDDLLPCSLSTDQLVEMLANMYGFTEKRVRKTLVALEAASAKRQSKSSNLSLVDRYLPVEKNGMIGNRPALKKLSSWLGAWKSGSDNRDRRYDDDLFAFEGDDSEEDGSRLYKLFVLKGDSGSGKSAVVYACAEELGYDIIEINAGQLRTGKAIVDIAGEATQSTRVLHSGDTKKKAKSSKKRRKEADSSKPSHLSLVLFEDVDLVFDEDKGFLSTLSSIAKHSKCPIVATCTDIPDNFPSVPPAITECISRPSPKEFALFLTLVAHLELIPVTRGILDRLGQLYCYDVRRSLQFLQTYRHQISCFNSRNHDRLLWKPALHSEGSDRAPISIDASQDDQRLSARPVAGWSTCPRRSFDLLTSNLLPSLEASQFAIEDHKTASREEKEAVVQHLGDVWSILDTASMANEWENSFEQRHTAFPSLGPEADDSFFHKEDVCLLCLDLRMLGLGSLFTGNDDSTSLKELRLRETNIQDAVTRALQLRHDEEERVIKVSKLADLKAKLNLPITVKGCGLVDASFSSDYIPMVARILESSEPLQESRRRASRRNHYLRDVLPDMSLADDIREFHGYSSCAQEPCETASLPKPSPMACAAASGTSILI